MIWPTADPLAEKYYDTSPYVFCQNNPVRFIDPTGMYFDEANEKKAQKQEKKLNKKYIELYKKAWKLEAKGQDASDVYERIGEVSKSMDDILDMRGSQDIEFKYAKASDKNNPAGQGNPNTIKTGTNDNGHDVVTMYSDGIGTQVHESRHGGQIARGEYGFDQNRNPTAGYGLNSEVSAYRAQYAYDGSFSYRQADYLRNASDEVANIFFSIGASIIPIVGVNNVNLINRALIQNIGEEGRFNGRRTWLPLYQRLR